LARSFFSQTPLCPIITLDNDINKTTIPSSDNKIDSSNGNDTLKSNKRLFSAPKLPDVNYDDIESHHVQKGITSTIPATPIARRLRSKAKN